MSEGWSGCVPGLKLERTEWLSSSPKRRLLGSLFFMGGCGGMADAADLKSAGGISVGVRVPPSPPQ
jgi:hypothetical protein